MGSNIPYTFNKISSFCNLKRITRFDLELINGYNDEDFLYNFVYKLNEIIEQQNIVGEAFEQVLNWANTMLETYTQEQLQKWLDDGTLGEIVNKVLFNKKVGYYNTVNDMINDDELIEGNVCFTLGYYSIGDNGSGMYLIKARGGEENIGDFIYLNNGLTAQLIENNIINMKQYGIIEGNQYDNANIINYAIKKANSITGGVVIIPIGEYYVKSQLLMKSNVTLKGIINQTADPIMGSIIRFSPPSPLDLFYYEDDDLQYNYLLNFNIENLEIYGDENANRMLNIKNLARSYIRNVTTKYGNIGIYLDHCMTVELDSLYILYPKKFGVLVDNYSLSTTVNISNTYIGQSTDYPDCQAIWVTREAVLGLNFNNCVIESIPKCVTISLGSVVNFNQCYFENCPSVQNELMFRLGILKDESSITNSGVDNLTAPNDYYTNSITNFTDCHMQTLQYNGNSTFLAVNYMRSVSFNSCNINGLTRILDNMNNFKSELKFKDCVLSSIKVSPDLSTYNYNIIYDNVQDVDRKRVYYLSDYYAQKIRSASTLSSANWYRIAFFDSTKYPYGCNVILGISSVYANTPPQRTLVALCLGSTNVALFKLVGTSANVIDKVRISKSGSNYAIDIHYNLSVANDIGCDIFSPNLQRNCWSISNLALSNESWTSVKELTL